MSKNMLTEVCELLAAGESYADIAEQTGWSEESIRVVSRSNIPRQEKEFDEDLRAVEQRVAERFEAEQLSYDDFDDEESLTRLYEREEGDPQELDFNDY